MAADPSNLSIAALFDASFFVDGLGFAASILTLAAFAQKAMLPMRLAAIGANVFFIAYGVLGPYPPVLVLHLVLLPLNLLRLGEILRDASGEPDHEQRLAPVAEAGIDILLRAPTRRLRRADAETVA